jgi:hypothetical protein
VDGHEPPTINTKLINWPQEELQLADSAALGGLLGASAGQLAGRLVSRS